MPGTIIRQYRELQKLSQTYVAKKLGISQNAYSKLENNITQLTVNHVKQLAAILQVPITDLLKDEFEIHKPTFPHTKSTQRDDVLKMLELLHEKLEKKHAARHDSYLTSMSLLTTVDHLLANVY